jgi:hypothetical protein
MILFHFIKIILFSVVFLFSCLRRTFLKDKKTAYLDSSSSFLILSSIEIIFAVSLILR